MSYARKRVLGTVAICVTFGAVQIAWGAGLSSHLLGAKGAKAGASATTGAVNRAAKADRAALAAMPSETTRTISFRVDRLPATSVVVRIPAQEAGGAGIPAAPIDDRRKPIVACEPVVSVLAEIAKQLQPGRCIT